MPVTLKNPPEEIAEEKPKVDINEKVDLFVTNLFPVPSREKLFFLRNLGVMLKAGIPLSAALKTLSLQTTSKKFKLILIDIAAKVEKGAGFSESMKPYEKIFGELMVNMIEAGEVSGKLEEVMAQVYSQFKKSYQLKAKVRSALAYPIVILVAMFGIGSFMIVFVVPKITEMFAGFNAELPLPTKILIAVSNAIAKNGIISAVLAIAAIVLIVGLLRTRQGKYYFQFLVLHSPVFGQIVKKINLAHLSRTLSSLLKTDIMIIKSFQISAGVTSNLHYREALQASGEKIRKGGKISEILSSYPVLFPPLVTQMISVGEETGELDGILDDIAQFYEEEVFQVMETLPSLIEPILILVLGCGIGGMAVAIIMPMYSLTSAI